MSVDCCVLLGFCIALVATERLLPECPWLFALDEEKRTVPVCAEDDVECNLGRLLAKCCGSDGSVYLLEAAFLSFGACELPLIALSGIRGGGGGVLPCPRKNVDLVPNETIFTRRLRICSSISSLFSPCFRAHRD